MLPSSTASLLFLTLLSLTTAQTTITVNTPQPTSSTYTSDREFRDTMLTAHNFYRKAHNASDLRWNDTLAEVADSWAEGCVFEHSGGSSGENLAVGYPNATSNVDAWALERLQYSWKDPGFAKATGHFTQLVWRNTTTVGCGRRNCTGDSDLQGYLVVCEYYPPGNVLGAKGDTQYFKDNVIQQTEGKGSDTVESGVTATSAGRSWNDARWGMGVFLAAGAVVLGIGL